MYNNLDSIYNLKSNSDNLKSDLLEVLKNTDVC